MTTLIDTTNTTNLVDVAREAADRLRPSASAHDVSGEISPSAFDMLRRLGITSALVPGQHGGRGVTHRDMGAIVRELGKFVAVIFLFLGFLVSVEAFAEFRVPFTGIVLGRRRPQGLPGGPALPPSGPGESL